MSGRTKVWAVTDGEYSDYRVVAVFETEADAVKAMTAGLGDDTTELDYYDPSTQPQRRQWINLGVHVKTGSAEVVNWYWGSDPDEGKEPSPLQRWHHPTRPKIEQRVAKITARAYGPDPVWRIEVEGIDTKRTRKVFYDLVAKTRAEIIEGVLT